MTPRYQPPRPVSRDERYYRLWEQILRRLGHVVASDMDSDAVETLDDLSRRLAEAQEDGGPPPEDVERRLGEAQAASDDGAAHGS